MAIIVLNWEQPATFIKQLEYWFVMLCLLVEKIENNNTDKGWNKEKVVVDDAREKCNKSKLVQSFFNEYKNSDTFGVSDNIPKQPEQVNNKQEALRINLGIPVLILVNKSDLLSNSDFEIKFGYKEQHIDFIQQVLRTFCLAFGCGLIYTNTQDIIMMEVLKQYMLYMLFKQPANYINTNNTPTSNAVIGSYFQVFETQPQIYKNNCVFVPIGFDSYNKIRIINEHFDCLAFTNNLLQDIQEITKTPNQNDEVTLGDFVYKKETKLGSMYAEKITMPTANTGEIGLSNNELEIKAIDEQIFLAQMHELLENTQAHPTLDSNKITSEIGATMSNEPSIGERFTLLNNENHPAEVSNKNVSMQSTVSNEAPEQATALNKFFVELLNKNNETQEEGEMK